MSKTTENIIQRRDLDPMLIRAREIVQYYEKAAECTVAVLGPDCCSPAQDSGHPGAMLFCALCERYNNHDNGNTGKIPEFRESPCAEMHRNGIQEARRQGGSYVYLCPMGFVFWTSPIYSGERFAGALLSSGVLGVDRQQAAENIFRACNGEVPRKEIEDYLKNIPEKTNDEIRALAQMMLICAEQISAADAVNPFKSEPFSRKENRSWTAADYSGDEVNENAYPLDKERMLLASLRRGDSAESRKILKDLLDVLAGGAIYGAEDGAFGSAARGGAGGNFEIFRLRAIELAVMLSRAAADPSGVEDPLILETNNRYLQKIEEARSPGAIYEILNIIIDRISGKIFSFQGIRHSSALRKAERFIWENYTRKISLHEIAAASGLSAPYFSTIFKDEMGENLSKYLNRLRVEKAAGLLAETDLPISGIAAACGFEDQSWFSKIFKTHTGISPGKYREQGGVYSMAEYN